MWPLINENKQKLDKRMQNYVILFFSKKNYFQRHESH